MAIETVEAVRQAEMKAAQLEKEAAQKKDTILLDAQQNAKNLIASMTKEALAKAEDALKKVNLQGTEMVQAAKVKAESEVHLMKEMVKGKEENAINLVISHVI